jgi:hypothetical protein
MAVIANVALTNTFDTWRTRTNVGFTRLNAFAINESSLYANTLTSNVAFTAKGTATVTGLFTASGRATVGTNLNVSGNTTFGAAGKTSNTTGWFGVTGRATVSTNLFVGGNTTLNGTTTDRSNALNQTLTDAATINWDVSQGRVATVTITASRAIAAPTNQKVGTYILRVVQGGSGNYTLTWNGNFKWTAQTAPVLSTTAGAVDIFTFFSDGSKMYGSYLPDVR